MVDFLTANRIRLGGDASAGLRDGAAAG
jgi:hypothetical protein